jgi:hypothetical protein
LHADEFALKEEGIVPCSPTSARLPRIKQMSWNNVDDRPGFVIHLFVSVNASDATRRHQGGTLALLLIISRVWVAYTVFTQTVK